MPSSLPHCLPYKPSDNLSQPISDPEISSTGNLITISHSSIAVGVIQTTVGQIVQITELLINRRVPANSHLVPEVKLLQQTLILCEFALQAYGDRPLGQSLANTITPAVERCRVVLQDLLNAVSSNRLNFVSVSDILGSVWWNGWDEDELTLLKKRLNGVRSLVSGVLLALNSVSWVELGNELGTSRVPLEQFHTLLSKRLPFLGHIRLNSVQVVDHLGRIIPVPMQFCSTWKEFDYIITCHCKKGPGSHFIERGDYEVMRNQDNQIISRSEFVVKSGMVLEMAIVMRQETANNKQCPSCNHLNLSVVPYHGWIECCGCPAQFQVPTQTVEESYEKDAEIYSEEDEVDEARGKWRGIDVDHNQEINTPASQGTAVKDNLQPPEDNSKRFFRRIRILHEVDSIYNSFAKSLNALSDSISHQRRLAADRPAEFNPALATSLNSLSNRFSVLGDQKQALLAIEEAVELRRRLAADHPAAYNLDLAISLRNLSKCLSCLRRKEALHAIEEAISLQRRLAADRPATLNPELARSLHDLADRLCALGKRGSGLKAIQEAVELRRQLAADCPTVFSSDLAKSLQTLSVLQTCRSASLQAIQEAVELQRRLAADHPTKFNPDLADSLADLSYVFTGLRRREEAMQAMQEAAELRRRLAANRPVKFNYDFGGSLCDLSYCLSVLDRREEAQQIMKEAFALKVICPRLE